MASYTISANFQAVLNGKWDKANKDSLFSFAVTELGFWLLSPKSKGLLGDSSQEQLITGQHNAL